MAFKRAECKSPLRVFRGNDASSYDCPECTYVYVFKFQLFVQIAGVRRLWSRLGSLAAQMCAECPQIDRICIAIAGIGWAEIV
jgi:hypothetical protein